MKIEQLKEEARKEFDETLGWTGEEYVTTPKSYDFIDSLIAKAYEEGKREKLEEIRSKIMNIELAVDKETIKKIEELSSNAEVVGYTQGMIFAKLEKVFQSLKDK